ncbi:MAG TPA: TonB-dependent receptor [Rhodothermales bacterium]|nr:TonB-dependent receptor [Rhodothermales bacterium]
MDLLMWTWKRCRQTGCTALLLVAGILPVLTASAQAQEPVEQGNSLLSYAALVEEFRRTSVYRHNADGLNRIVRVQLEGVSRRRALEHVAALGGFRVAFCRDRVPLEEKISLSVDGLSVLGAMQETVRGSGLHLKLSLGGQFIVVKGPPVKAVEPPRPQKRSAPGTIAGRVTDVDTRLSLPGASVRVQGTALGAATDVDGNYRITNVPEGDQVLLVSYVGYKSAHVPVVVASGESVLMDVTLSVDVVEGHEVLILAQAEGQVAAINQQLASNTIVNVVSAARIQELPDVNAAESVGRLPGVSIVRDAGEGQKVVIRGLSPKFSNVLVNGQRIPGTDFDDRSTDLSMISSDMLAGIEVTKALTPDRDADMIGGTVDFRLMDAREGFRSDVRVQSGYNDQQSTYDSYKGSINASNRFFGNRLGAMAQVNIERADRGSDVFNAGYTRQAKQVEPGQPRPIDINSLTLTDRFESRNRYGGSLVLDYRLPGGRIQLSNFISRLNRNESRWTKGYGLVGRNVSYTVRDRDVNVDVLSNALEAEHSLGRATIDISLSRSLSRQDHPYDNSFIFSEVAAFTPELVITAGPSVIPQAAKNRLSETFLQDGDFRSVDMLEREIGARANLRYPLAVGRHLTGYVKFGGKYRDKKRSNDASAWFLPFGFGDGDRFLREAFAERQFDVTTQGRLAITGFLDPEREAANFLDGQYGIDAFLDRELMDDVYNRINSRYFRTRFTDLADFEMSEKITAGYGMAEINLGRHLMILPGVRYEHTNTDYDAKKGVSDNDRTEVGFMSDTSSTQSFGQWFPIVHVRLRFTDWLDLRLARTRSLSRPDFPMYSPRERIQESPRRVDRGNPSLRPASALNYDALVSLYPGRLGLLTIGGYFKEIENVIYLKEKTVLDPAQENLPAWTRGFRLTEPVNNDFVTTVKGIEAEWQTHFTYLPGLLSGLVLNINYARIFSKTRYPRTLLIRDSTPPFRQTSIDTFRVGRMIDQPEQIANFSIGYDRGGFSGRVSMLYQESSLSFVGEFAEEDGFTETYIRWDAMMQQRFGSGFSVYINLANLGDRPDQSFLGVGFPTAQEYYGWTADLGVRYRY